MQLEHGSRSPLRAAPRTRFVRLLQLAYSSELGAAAAYAGHAASVSDPGERRRILHIRSEELDHRARLARMLARLGSGPDPHLERLYRCVGSGIAGFCRVGGWFLPMYGAGWLERQNIGEYERAARLGVECGEGAFADELLYLAEVEWEHERFFRLKAGTHWLARLLRVWRAPAPRDEIRRGFARFVDGRAARVAAEADRADAPELVAWAGRPGGRAYAPLISTTR
jgi:hypothetical protein